MKCVSCSTTLAPDARFCSSCGAPALGTPDQERRVVTVLFADVVGFTRLAERADPEHVTRLIDGLLQRLVGVVEEFGGWNDNIIGDCVLALFGAPIAHEDDPERAVRAGLKMLEVVADYNREQNEAFDLRIGINTGEVLVGTMRAGGGYTAMGDTVNTASRLQTMAPIGSVLVGETTKTLSDGPIRYRALGALQAKGREQVVDAWVAVEARFRPGEHRRRRNTPLVGRDEEHRMLLASIDYAIAKRRALLVAIDGEGGVGKSRLSEEAVRAARTQHGLSVLVGSCVAYGEANVWWPLATALNDALQLGDADSERTRDSVTRRAAQLLGRSEADGEVNRIVESYLHLIGQASSLDRLDAVRAREEITHTVVTALQARCRKGPLMLAIADIHWGDSVVMTLLEQLLSSLANQPFVLLTTSRPDIDSAWPPPSTTFTSLHLRLEPLDRSSTEQLAAAILGDDADASVLASLYDRSGGNPLFLEELATIVADGGTVGDLPDNLRALVAARLDRLPAEQRNMLDNAAVLGTSGWLQGLLRFAEARGQHADAEILDALVDAGLLSRDGRRWRFRSQALRDVAYNTLTKAVRALRHTGIADTMVTLYEGMGMTTGAISLTDASQDTGVSRDEIAHHYATAAELVAELGPVAGVPGHIVDLALSWSIRAAERASQQNYMKSASRVATRALDLLGEEVDDAHLASMIRLSLIRAVALTELRSLPRARADLDRVLRVSVLNNDLESEAEARRILGTVVRLSGNLPGARGELSEAVRLLRQVDNPLRLARALRDRAFAELLGGDLRLAEDMLEEADELTKRADDPIGSAWVEWHRAWLSFISGDLAQAEERLGIAAAAMTALGDRGGLGWVNGLLAYVRYFEGRIPDAEALAAQVLEEALDRGDDWAAGMMQALQANLRLWQGSTDEAFRLGESARARFQRMGDGFGELQSLAPLARAAAALGRTSVHTRLIEDMHLLGGTYGMEGLVLFTEAMSAAHLGESTRAVRAAELAIERAQERYGLSGEAWATQALGLVQLGHPDDAQRCLDRAWDRQGVGPSPFFHAVQVLVHAAQGQIDAAVSLAAELSQDLSATYLDHVYAGLGAALAHAQSGSPRAVANALDRAHAVALRTGDVVAKAIIETARMSLHDGAQPENLPDVDVALHGWRRLFDAAAHGS